MGNAGRSSQRFLPIQHLMPATDRKDGFHSSPAVKYEPVAVDRLPQINCEVRVVCADRD